MAVLAVLAAPADPGSQQHQHQQHQHQQHQQQQIRGVSSISSTSTSISISNSREYAPPTRFTSANRANVSSGSCRSRKKLFSRTAGRWMSSPSNAGAAPACVMRGEGTRVRCQSLSQLVRTPAYGRHHTKPRLRKTTSPTASSFCLAPIRSARPWAEEPAVTRGGRERSQQYNTRYAR